MPQFLVRVFTQCAVPGTTPDLDNTEAKLPRRMLYEHPPFMSALLAAAKSPLYAESVLDAARTVLPEGFQLALVPEPYQHREINGVYVKQAGLQPTESPETIYVLQTTKNGSPEPLAVRQTIPVKATLQSAGMTASDELGATKNIAVEFRVHLVVREL